MFPCLKAVDWFLLQSCIHLSCWSKWNVADVPFWLRLLNNAFGLYILFCPHFYFYFAAAGCASLSIPLASSVGLVRHHWSDLFIILFRFCVCRPALVMWAWPQTSCTPTSHCPSTSWCPCWRRTGRTSGRSTSKAPWDQPRESSKQMTLVSSNGENGCPDIGFGDEK